MSRVAVFETAGGMTGTLPPRSPPPLGPSFKYREPTIIAYAVGNVPDGDRHGQIADKN